MKCIKCGETRESEFYKDRRTICKKCHRQTVLAWRERNPEKYKELKRICDNEYQKKYAHTPIGRYWRLKTNARTKGNRFDISRDDFIKWLNNQPPTCYYCGQTFGNQNGRKHNMDSMTIDRKDNRVGYNLTNIVTACRRCNLIKGEWFTEAEMLEIAERYFPHMV